MHCEALSLAFIHDTFSAFCPTPNVAWWGETILPVHSPKVIKIKVNFYLHDFRKYIYYFPKQNISSGPVPGFNESAVMDTDTFYLPPPPLLALHPLKVRGQP